MGIRDVCFISEYGPRGNCITRNLVRFQARAIKKKLSQIYVLKTRLEAGEELEPEQIAKISKEKELSDELKQLEL